LSLLPLSVTRGQDVRRLSGRDGEGLGEVPPMVVSLYAREDQAPIGELVEMVLAVLESR